jgi:hypothetical protein
VPVRHALDGATAALIACGTLPAVLLAFASAAALWDLRTALTHALFCGVLGVLLAEALTMTLDKVPFTCTYMPGKANIVKLWPLYLTIFSFYTVTMASLEAALLRGGGIAVAIGVFTAFTVVAAVVRRRRASGLPDLRFEEQPADALTVVSF